MITHCKLKLLNSLLFRMHLKHKIICGTAFEAQGLCGTASVLHGFVKVTLTMLFCYLVLPILCIIFTFDKILSVWTDFELPAGIISFFPHIQTFHHYFVK